MDLTADLDALISSDIPSGRDSLLESFSNLERVAEYCESFYRQSCTQFVDKGHRSSQLFESKKAALEVTKGYTTQSLASVAYQINTLAYNFLQMLDLQTGQLADMASQVNHIEQTVNIHKEKVARREIGVLTTNKCANRQYKIIAPANPAGPVKYVRKQIDYTVLDDIGHGVRLPSRDQNFYKRTSPGSNSGYYANGGGGSIYGVNMAAGPAPTTKPPTPPQMISRYSSSSGSGGTLSRSKEYRSPSVVAPPQVPSNYAAGGTLQHLHTSSNASRNNVTGKGLYGTLPHFSCPQVGMVHPVVQNDSMVPQSHDIKTDNKGAYLCDSVQIGMRPASPPLPPPPQNSIMRQSSEPSMFPRQFSVDGTAVPSSTMNQLIRKSSVQGSMSNNASQSLPDWVPHSYLERVTAIYDYKADKDDELSFQEDSTIYVLKKNDDGWWEGIMDGVTGLFPGNYVEALF